MPTLERTDTGGTAQRDLKKGVKAVSFLSRLIGQKKKPNASSDSAIETTSMSSEQRPEGNDAAVFAQNIDNIAYNPRHPPPPAYIKVRTKYKRKQEFDRLFLAQELECRPKRVNGVRASTKLRRKNGPMPDAQTVWAMEFSRDGKYLAAAGVDAIVRVWAVLSSAEERATHQRRESSDGESHEHLSAPVFSSQPVKEFEGHTSTILDLSWSKNNFLLSSSMDKSVRLWHVSRPECLVTFRHNDFVPSIAFHPKDDRFFLAGSLDSRLRLWSIPDKSVAFSAQCHDMITAVGFTPDGKYAIAGCLSGLCMFYETEGFKYQTQMHVRSARGANAKGSKITGIQAVVAAGGEIKLLITSNDSRVRLYNFRDKSLELKFKGNENNCSQIRATLSDDGRYVVCGSEDRKAYVWSMGPAEGEKREQRPVEMFEAHDTITTVVCFAPTKTKVLLSRSEDPLYDLCNPPPVTLRSRAESQSSTQRPADSVLTAEPELSTPTSSTNTYSSRCSHRGGNIIVTADFTGRIKVFRQDCAWAKRSKADDWDRSSLFTKRGGRSSIAGSLATKASQLSLRERTSTSTQPSGERIMNWRQGMTSSHSLAGGGASRSSSPMKKGDSRKGSTEAKAATASVAPSTPKTTPPVSEVNGKAATSPPSKTTPPGSDENALMLEGERSTFFWDPERYRPLVESRRKARESIDADASLLGVRPQAQTQESYVSQLSDERSSGDEQEFDDAKERVQGR